MGEPRVQYVGSQGGYKATTEHGTSNGPYATKLEAWAWIIANTQSEVADAARALIASAVTPSAPKSKAEYFEDTAKGVHDSSSPKKRQAEGSITHVVKRPAASSAKAATIIVATAAELHDWEQRVKEVMRLPPWGDAHQHICEGIVNKTIEPIVASIGRQDNAALRFQFSALAVHTYITSSTDGEGVGFGLREGCRPIDEECYDICRVAFNFLRAHYKQWVLEPEKGKLERMLRQCQNWLNSYAISAKKYGGNDGFAILVGDIADLAASL